MTTIEIRTDCDGWPPTPDVFASSARTPATVSGPELARLRRDAALGRAAYTAQIDREADDLISAAIAAGRFAPDRREHFTRRYRSDPDGTATLIASLAPGLVPFDERGWPEPDPHRHDPPAWLLPPADPAAPTPADAAAQRIAFATEHGDEAVYGPVGNYILPPRRRA